MDAETVTIDYDNCKEFFTGTHPNITSLKWRVGPLYAGILHRCPNLRELDYQDEIMETVVDDILEEHGSDTPSSRVTELIKEDLEADATKPLPLRVDLLWLKDTSHLEVLKATRCGLMSLEGIGFCPKLRILQCFENKIASLEPLAGCPELVDLDCTNNRIISLTGIGLCPKLEKLACTSNPIQSLVSIRSCPFLRTLYVSGTSIGTLDGIQACAHLEKLFCADCKLTSLDGIEYCGKLTILDCMDNQITSLDILIPMQDQIDFIMYGGNPIIKLPDHIQASLDRRMALLKAEIDADTDTESIETVI